ncbi:hypothetical protein Y1Q_0021790 [Alligator mississippiensis]|uniref:Uncharacterized protein n=1 Tax=Alligator mississippiensis TaxID=8496 RepID=A0A151PAY1_ALLMI|nr:hypothetical protein Y1Q_0021790 [Alligator mississippiensis]
MQGKGGSKSRSRETAGQREAGDGGGEAVGQHRGEVPLPCRLKALAVPLSWVLQAVIQGQHCRGSYVGPRELRLEHHNASGNDGNLALSCEKIRPHKEYERSCKGYSREEALTYTFKKVAEDTSK